MTSAAASPGVRPRATRRFIACLGFVNTPTNEAYPRTLVYPSSGAETIRPYGLIPVLDLNLPGQNVGTIFDAFVMGNMILGVGYLAADSPLDQARIAAVRRGELVPELDVSGRMSENEFGMEFYGWRVRAVTLGSNPTWIIPPVHFPED